MDQTPPPSLVSDPSQPRSATVSNDASEAGHNNVGPPGRLSVTVDDETYEAGDGCILPITIHNPFEYPVEIIELTQPRSSSLREINKQPSIHKANSKWANLLKHVKLPSLFGGLAGASIDWGGIKAQFGQTTKELTINASNGALIDVGQGLQNYDSVIVNASTGARIVATNASDGASAIQTIEPHCEKNAFLNIETKGWLFFKPTRLRLKSEIRYRVNGRATEYTQVMSLNVDVRPPIRSVLLGAISGALLGSTARFINDATRLNQDVLEMPTQGWVMQGLKLSGAVTMAVIGTIALSRKTGAQGFITVEDFFGGFVVGVLVGYQGTTYFESILSQTTPKTPAQ